MQGSDKGWRYPGKLDTWEASKWAKGIEVQLWAGN